MGNELKKSAPAYLGMFLIALVVAVLARVGLAVMDNSGVLSYNYRAATQPYGTEGLSTLDQLPMTLTGGQFIGFIFIGGLCLSLAVAAAMLFAHVFEKGEGKLGTALVWGFATAIVSFACLIIVVLGMYSRVLLSSMTSGGGEGGSLGLTLGLLVLCVGTLIAAASMVLHAAYTREGSWKRMLWAVLLALVCGAVVCVFVVGGFGAINAMPSNSSAIAGWLGAAIVANCVLLFVGNKLAS